MRRQARQRACDQNHQQICFESDKRDGGGERAVGNGQRALMADHRDGEPGIIRLMLAWQARHRLALQVCALCGGQAHPASAGGLRR